MVHGVNQQATLSVTEAELGWLAGIIDGEGTVVLYVSIKGERLWGAYPQIVVGNTEQVMIEKVADILKRLGVGVHVSHREPRHPNGVSGTQKSKYRTLHLASVVGFLRSKKLLEAITPYLVTIKKERSELMLRYIDQRCARIYPDGVRRSSVVNKYTVEDVRLMLQIMKMGKSKHIPIVERVLRDLEQARPTKPDDIVRPTRESRGEVSERHLRL